jgi:hypothetical protein
MDPLFTVPCLLVVALAVALGLRSSSEHGTARGVWTFAKTIGLGFAILVVLWVALLVGYYRGGGH